MITNDNNHIPYGRYEALERELRETKDMLADALKTIAEQKARIDWMAEKIRVLTSRRFGRSRENQFDGQLMLDVEKFVSEADAKEAALAALNLGDADEDAEREKTQPRRRKQKGGKDDKLKALPVKRLEYRLPEADEVCPRCGKPHAELAPVVVRRLEIIPPQVSVIETVQHTYAICGCADAAGRDEHGECTGADTGDSAREAHGGPLAAGKADADARPDGAAETEIVRLPLTSDAILNSVYTRYKETAGTPDADGGSLVIRAPMPLPAVPRCMATEGTLAHVITQKFQFGAPLYRQEAEWRMLGVSISRQSMANWVIAACMLCLLVVYDRMRDWLLRGDIVHADESPLQVLNEPGRKAQSQSYMWLYRSGRDGPPIVLFDYRQTREAKHPREFLQGFSGYLCTDGYKGYYNWEGVVNVACWAHCRRYFDEALRSLPASHRDGPTASNVGLGFCNKVFEIERFLRDADTETRFKERQRLSAPVLSAFKVWLDEQAAKTVSKNHLGKAVRYALEYWEPLCNFMKDGRLFVDNNISERKMKAYVTGRKNWLFANTPDGAKAAAVSYSLVETALENGLKPFEYIKHLLQCVPNSNVKEQSVLDSLMPWADSIPDCCRIQPRPPRA